MKKILTAALCLLVASMLASCGAQPPGGQASDDQGSPGGPPAEAGAFPATIDTEFGPVTVEEKPIRVVALGWGDAEAALALGVEPVGASDWLAFGGNGVGPWATSLYTTDPTIIGTLEPSYEEIAALDPDLILDVKSSGDPERHERLASIATTVGIPQGKQSYLTSVEEQVTMIAAALGMPEQGEQLLAEQAQRVADVVEAHPEFTDKTITVAAHTSEGWSAYIGESERVKFMTRLGFVQNPQIEAIPPTGFSATLAEEQLALLDADLLIVFPIGVPASAVTDQPLFQRIPAVTDGRAIVFEEVEKDIRLGYSANTILSIPFALDKLVPRMAEVLA